MHLNVRSDPTSIDTVKHHVNLQPNTGNNLIEIDNYNTDYIQYH